MSFRKILSIFFPAQCPFCKDIISGDEVVCQSCEKKINRKLIKTTLTTREGQKFECVAPFAYVEPIRGAIHDYKFKGAKNFAVPFGKYVADVLAESLDVTRVDLITSVPLHRARKRERGFNQAEIFAKEVSRLMSIRYAETLKKVKRNKTQHELSQQERVENVKDVYAIIDSEEVKGKTIVICDDILTTGNTMAECANVILKSGARTVIGATIANVENRPKTIDKK